MKHIFTSGEEIYKNNLKQLTEGMLVASHIIYDDIKADTVFEVVGTLDELPVSIKFKIKESGFSYIKFRYDVKILVQSDLICAEWESYNIIPL